MLQWMGGARRKMKATKGSKLKRQREFFDRRKEKKRRNEFGVESGKLLTLADYIRQNLHGGESLDILGLRSLNPTSANVNTPANSDANLPDPAIASLKAKLGNAGGANVASSNVSTSSVGALDGDGQGSSSLQPECKINSRRITQEQKQAIERAVFQLPSTQTCSAHSQRISGVAHAAKQDKKKLVSQNSELPLPGKGRNPVHVGNLQTKKVAPAPRLNLMDAITSDAIGASRGKKRSPSEAYAVFSQDVSLNAEIDASDEKIFGHHPQQALVISDRNVADWGDTKHLFPSSTQLNNTSDCNSETQGTSDLLSRFLSTPKLKSFKGISSHQHGRQPQGHNITGKAPLLETEYLLNSFRVTHNEGNSGGFSISTSSTTSRQVKEEPRRINLSTAMFDLESFHVKQEVEEFNISDPFVTVASHHVKLEHQDQGLSYPFTITNNHQVKRECHEFDFLNSRFSTGDDQVTQGYPLLTDFSYDRDTFDVGRNFFERKKGSSSPGSNPVNWDFDLPLNTSSTSAYFRETAAIKLDKLRLPLSGFDDKEQHAAAAFSSVDDFSPTWMKTNRSNFENEPSDWEDVLMRKNCAYSDEWNCDHSEAWGASGRQENNDLAYSGGNSGQMRNHDDNSWSQTVAGGTAEYLTDYLTGDINVMHFTSPRYAVMQGKDLFSETRAIIAPEILQDSKLTFLPQINNDKEDFIIVCFSDNEDSPNVDANTIHLPVQSINIPSQLLGTVESSSKTEHDMHVLSPETPLNRISRDADDSRVFGHVVTTEKTTTTTNNKSILRREDSPCDTVLKSSHQSRKEYLPRLNSVSSLQKGIEGQSWQAKEPRSEAYPESQSRRPSPKILAIEGEKFEDGLEHHSSNSDKADQCFSSNVLYNHCDDHATVQHETVQNVEENSLEACYSNPLKEVLRENINRMSATKENALLQKRSKSGNAHDYGCQASFSSQEECSPAFQHNTVQAVLCKLQRPVCSCGSKQGKFPEHVPIKNVDTVLLKLQKPTKPSSHGPGHQVTEGNQTLQKDIELKGDINQNSHLELEIKPTAEYKLSRGSLPLSNASKPSIRSSKEDAQNRGLSDVTNQRTKEARMSLDDIDAIASSCHRVFTQPYRRENESNTHSFRSGVEIMNVPKFSVPAGDCRQHGPTSVSQRNQILVTPEEEQPSTRISDPPAGGAGEDCTRSSQKNPNLVVPDKEQSHLADFKLSAFHAGALEISSNTPQVSARQEVLEASQDQEGANDTLHHQPRFENFEQGGGSTTGYDAAYVKMLESYVVQLKLENRILRYHAQPGVARGLLDEDASNLRPYAYSVVSISPDFGE